MKRGLLLLTLLLCPMMVLAVDIDSCQTLSASGVYDLNQSIASTTGCFTVTASDVLINCHGYQISYNTGGGSSHRGILAENVNNISVMNCPIIDTTAAGFETYTVRYSNVTRGNIENNTMIAIGATGAQYNIRLGEGTEYVTIANNELNATSSVSDLTSSVFTTGASHILIENNTINVAGGFGTGNYGMYLTTHADNITAKNNIVTATAIANADQIYGIYFYNNVSNSRIVNNTVSVSGSPDDAAGGITTSAGPNTNNNNLIENNTISVPANTAPVRSGITPVKEFNTIVRSNTITMPNLPGFGIDVALSNHTILTDNTVILQGAVATGIRIRTNAANNTFIGNTITGIGPWIETVSSSIFDATFYNTTFTESGTPLRINGPFNVSVSIGNVTPDDMEVNATQAFVNVTAKPFLNTSGQVTITGLGFDYYRPLVDYTDNGTFEDCPTSLCTIISQSVSELVFRVEHFTTFSSAQGTAPDVPEFSTWVMLVLLGVTTTGLVAMRRR